MSTQNESKINLLLQSQPPGVVMLSSWLAEQDYNLDLQKRYRKSKWLESIGSRAMVRSGDKIDFTGALYALQSQNGLGIHVGAKFRRLLTPTPGILANGHFCSPTLSEQGIRNGQF